MDKKISKKLDIQVGKKLSREISREVDKEISKEQAVKDASTVRILNEQIDSLVDSFYKTTQGKEILRYAKQVVENFFHGVGTTPEDENNERLKDGLVPSLVKKYGSEGARRLIIRTLEPLNVRELLSGSDILGKTKQAI